MIAVLEAAKKTKEMKERKGSAPGVQKRWGIESGQATTSWEFDVATWEDELGEGLARASKPSLFSDRRAVSTFD
jgi:hypothetical protein